MGNVVSVLPQGLPGGGFQDLHHQLLPVVIFFIVQLGNILRFRHRLRSGGQRDALAAAFAAALRAAQDEPEAAWPDDPRPNYLPEVLDAAKEAVAFLRERAAEVHVDAAVVANRAAVTAFVDNPDDAANPLANGWRYEVFGRDIATRFAVP